MSRAARGEKLYEGEIVMSVTKWRHKLERIGLSHNEAIMAFSQAESEIHRLRSAMKFIANHTAEPGTALDTVVKFAAATLEPTP